MNNSSSIKNISLGAFALFSAFAFLRFTGVITSPVVPNRTVMLNSSRAQLNSGSAKAQVNSVSVNCDPCTNRYPSPETIGGMMIANGQFIGAISMYQNTSNLIQTRTRSVFVSKRAIDYMLNNNCNANGLNCYFGLNTINGQNKLVLMLTAATSSQTDFDQISNPRSIVFQSDVLCPDECGAGDTTLNFQPKAALVNFH